MEDKKKILLTDIIKIDDPKKYKLHLGCKVGKSVPLDLYGHDKNNWIAWNRTRGRNNIWNKDYIFSFIQYYHIPDAWLFAGVFEVLARHEPSPPDYELEEGYDIEPVADFEKFDGRLICVSTATRKRGQGRGFLLESFLDSFEVREILPIPYDGPEFPGYENINLSFSQLKSIVVRRRRDWEDRLNVVKCVYLITDTSTGKYYVGSAYGDGGAWSRLSCYIETGHGWDQGLKELIDKKEAQGVKNYAMEHFKFSILEIFTQNTSEGLVKDREQYWKDVLMSLKHGNYNRN